MDALTEDQAFQAVLDPDLGGIDNEALEFHIEDYINSDDTLCLPDDPLSSLSYSTPGSLGHLHHRHFQQQQHQQQQQQHHHHQQQQQQQQHCRAAPHASPPLGPDCGQQQQTVAPLPPPLSGPPEGGGRVCGVVPPDLHSDLPPHLPHLLLHQPQQLHHHQQQQCQMQPAILQHHQLQHHQLLQQQASADNGSSMYSSSCGLQSHGGRLAYDHLHQQQLQHHNSTPLPDTPPDSGSEPYSPLDDSSLAFEPHQQHSLLSQHRMSALPDLGFGHSKLSPAYLGGPPDPHKFNPTAHPQGPPQSSNGGGGGMGMVAGMGTPPGVGLPHPHQVPPSPGGSLPPHSYLPQQFGSMNNLTNQPNKKRKMSDSPTNTLNATLLPSAMSGVLIKQEPPLMVPFSHSFVGDCSNDDDFSYELDSNVGFSDGAYQVIKWQSFNATSWNTLTDANFKDLPSPTYRVDADKGFNFSVPDESFVCQKKNHFQVTVHVGLQGNPQYVRTPEGVKKIEGFYVHFQGVKMESPTQNIKIEQSQSDRSKRPFHPVKVDLVPDQVIKLTVGRLHFSETTSNNMRKKGKPNPDQRYFRLVVALHAQSGHGSYLVCAHSSERIIVRASNPGQFDNEVDVMWQKGHTGESVYHVGRVGVNTDHPEEALTVHGNMRLTGHLLQPSDLRAKEKIEEVDSKDQLENVQKLRIYRYEYKEEFAEHAGIPPEHRHDTGVLAQEILHVLPDAVRSTGDVRLPSGHTLDNFLVVNKDRIFMENVGAVKELCKLTDNLEVRIDELEKMNKRLASLKRFDSIKSTYSAKSTASSASTLSTSAGTQPHKHNTTTSTSSNSNVSDSSNSNSHNHKDLRNSNSRYRHSHRDHHGRRHSSSTLNGLMHMNKMCGNRFLQVTILILILIMAFCLIAITTLYIMELHKQRASGDSPSPALQGTLIPPTTTPEMRSTPSNRSIPIGSEPSNLNFTATTSIPHAPTEGPKTATITTTTKPTTTKTTGSPPLVIERLAYPPCGTGECEVYCCPLPPEDDPTHYETLRPIVIHGGSDEDGVLYNINDSGGDGEEIMNEGGASIDTVGNHNGVVSMTIPGAPPTDTTRNATDTTRNTTSTSTTTSDESRHNNEPIQVVLNDNGNKGPMYSVLSNMQSVDKRGSSLVHRFMYKRQVAGSVALLIKEMNASLDRFCESGCQGNNQSYFITLAPYFYLEAVTLQFRMTEQHHVAFCHISTQSVCVGVGGYLPPGSDVKSGTLAEFSLRVGAHVQSNYSFRLVQGLAVPENATEICNLEPTSGLVIKDYLLKFKRSCDDGPY